MTNCIKTFGLDRVAIQKLMKGLATTNEKISVSNLDAKITFDTKTSIAVSEVYQRFEDYMYAVGDETLETFLFKLLKMNNKMVATAESITGGAIATAITHQAGASEYFYEGIVCYNAQSKIERLGVNPDTIEKHTIVSKEVAYEMAKGLCVHEDILAISTTGVAGPGTLEDNPVGKVCIGVGSNDFVVSFERHFKGDRDEIIAKARNAGLFYAIRYLRSDLIKLMDTVGEYAKEE